MTAFLGCVCLSLLSVPPPCPLYTNVVWGAELGNDETELMHWKHRAGSECVIYGIVERVWAGICVQTLPHYPLSFLAVLASDHKQNGLEQQESHIVVETGGHGMDVLLRS